MSSIFPAPLSFLFYHLSLTLSPLLLSTSPLSLIFFPSFFSTTIYNTLLSPSLFFSLLSLVPLSSPPPTILYVFHSFLSSTFYLVFFLPLSLSLLLSFNQLHPLPPFYHLPYSPPPPPLSTTTLSSVAQPTRLPLVHYLFSLPGSTSILPPVAFILSASPSVPSPPPLPLEHLTKAAWEVLLLPQPLARRLREARISSSSSSRAGSGKAAWMCISARAWRVNRKRGASSPTNLHLVDLILTCVLHFWPACLISWWSLWSFL